MKTQFATTCAILATLLGFPAGAMAQDSASSTSHAVTYVKDSAITTKNKSKLAAEHLASLNDIHVATDSKGIVWLSGRTRTQEAADKAVSIARGTAHVTRVHSDIKVGKSD